MVQYTLAQSPEIILTVPGKDSSKARDKAMDQLLDLMEEGKLSTDLSDGFGKHQFIEVKEPAIATSDDEDAVTQAVQVLSHLATLKQKVQASRVEAMKIREQIDPLFTDELMDDDELTQLRENFKVLKTFAQLNLRYREARTQAVEARSVLDQALKSQDA
jgi:soluble cytochrome b562